MCEICEKTFNTRKGKEMHINNIHGELKPNNFKCDICDKSFSKSHSLRLHMYTVHESNIGHGNITNVDHVVNYFLKHPV